MSAVTAAVSGNSDAPVKLCSDKRNGSNPVEEDSNLSEHSLLWYQSLYPKSYVCVRPATRCDTKVEIVLQREIWKFFHKNRLAVCLLEIVLNMTKGPKSRLKKCKSLNLPGRHCRVSSMQNLCLNRLAVCLSYTDKCSTLPKSFEITRLSQFRKFVCYQSIRPIV